ncbi:MAG: hypothetical protein K2H76_10025 [Muribaculaceae bacterium]|nr:hypothetical protein [Muribaculaceae bacterium]MDE6027247.1 hypothetical protein [Muribaculaceae bacterium]
MMKQFIFRLCGLASILAFCVSAGSASLSENQDGSNGISITSSSTIEEIREELNGMDIFVLDFKMNGGDFPTCDYIEHPEGCNGY